MHILSLLIALLSGNAIQRHADRSQTPDRSFIALPRRVLIPMHGSVPVRRDSIAGHQCVPQRELRFRHTLLSRSLKPINRLLRVGFATLTLSEHHGEVVLRDGMPLLRGDLVPAHALSKIVGDAIAGAIHDGKLELRSGIACARGLGHPGRRGPRVSHTALRIGIQKRQRVLRLDMATLAARVNHGTAL